MIGTKVLSRNEFNKSGIDTNAFEFNYEPGKFEASIVLMAQGHYGILRVFLEFDDGRKIIAPVWGWQDYLGFYDRKPGDRVCLIYEQVGEKGVFPKYATTIEEVADDEEVPYEIK